MKNGVEYHVQHWQPAAPSWVPGSKLVVPAHWKTSWIVRGPGAKASALRDRQNENAMLRFPGNGFKRCRVLRIETRTEVARGRPNRRRK